MKNILILCLDKLFDIYKKHNRTIYQIVLVATVFLTILTVIHQSFYSFSQNQPLNWTIPLLFFFCFVAISLILGDLLSKGLTSRSQIELVEWIREDELVDDIISTHTEIIETAGSVDDNTIKEFVDEIIQVVHGELRFDPIMGVINLWVKVGLLIILFTLISMNLTYYTQTAIFHDLEPGVDWMSHLYNTIVAMFLGGYDNAYPIHGLSRVLAITEIFTGVFTLVVVFHFVISNPRHNISLIRDAIRIYLYDAFRLTTLSSS